MIKERLKSQSFSAHQWIFKKKIVQEVFFISRYYFRLKILEIVLIFSSCDKSFLKIVF